MNLEEQLRQAWVFSDVSDDRASAFTARAWEQLKKRQPNRRTGIGKILKRRFGEFTAAAAVLAFVIVGFGVYRIQHGGHLGLATGSNASKPVQIGAASIDPTLPGNFSRATLLQIRADLKDAPTKSLDHEVYALTGGLGTANPKIGMWDSSGNMTFSVSGTVYDLQELSESPALWRLAPHSNTILMTNTTSASGTPIPWTKKHTESGQTYYEWDGMYYYFKKGNAYIYLTIALGTATARHTFPEGIIRHLVPIGNPVTH